jgi:hypothetical protein
MPQWALRFIFPMLTLLVGGLGAYRLTLSLFKQKTLSYKVAASLAGIFYILNLSTVQTYYVPFETFTAHFAATPWFLWATLNYFRSRSTRDLLIFGVVSFLVTPSYYVPTLFVVSCMGLAIVALSHFSRMEWSSWIRSLMKLLVVLFVTNAFWLLPFAYFTITNSHAVVDSKINQMATENIFLDNKKYGTLENVAILKGFWIDRTDPDINGNYTYMMARWGLHVTNPIFLWIGYFLFGVILCGLFWAIKNRGRSVSSILGIFALSFTMLMVDAPPFSWIGTLLRTILPLFDQAFRFPFTKFSILASLSYAVLFSFGAVFITSFLKRFNVWRTCVLFMFALPIILFSFPAFKGELFYSKEQIAIPQDYFQAFSYFEKQGNGRIANFPQHTFWGWNYYKWGYGGSGFLWYGIDQPVLDRAFDPWEGSGENYYWEISQALYSKDLVLFESLFEKYQINWLLLDESVINPISPKSLYVDELEYMLAQSSKIDLTAEFGNLKLYKVNLDVPVQDFVFTTNDLPHVGPTYKWNMYDKAYSTLGNYRNDDSSSPDYYYPFRSLLTKRDVHFREFKVREEEDSFVFESDSLGEISGYDLVLPQETKEVVSVDPQDLGNITHLQPTVSLQNNVLEVRVPKAEGYFVEKIDPTGSRGQGSCSTDNPEISAFGALIGNGVAGLEFKNTGDTFCGVSFWLPTLENNLSYIVRVDSKHISGAPLSFWLENVDNRKADFETYLPKDPELVSTYFIQPPMDPDGIGYTFHFDNHSIGRIFSRNQLVGVSAYPFPYKFLEDIHFVKPNLIERELETEGLEVQVSHPNQSLYDIRGNFEGRTIVLSQTFDKGWQAFGVGSRVSGFFAPFLGKRISNHFMVNNWENGWQIEGASPGRIVLVYLPQYLEFIGFVLLSGGAIFSFVYFNLKKSRS